MEELLMPITLQGVVLAEDVVKLGLDHALEREVLGKLS
jgi:hypothetical protein